MPFRRMYFLLLVLAPNVSEANLPARPDLSKIRASISLLQDTCDSITRGNQNFRSDINELMKQYPPSRAAVAPVALASLDLQLECKNQLEFLMEENRKLAVAELQVNRELIKYVSDANALTDVTGTGAMQEAKKGTEQTANALGAVITILNDISIKIGLLTKKDEDSNYKNDFFKKLEKFHEMASGFIKLPVPASTISWKEAAVQDANTIIQDSNTHLTNLNSAKGAADLAKKEYEAAKNNLTIQSNTSGTNATGMGVAKP